ncbi:MAG TPA: acyl-CoA dehydrogenase family protein [Pseudonocardiaceae bacterium]
MAVQSSPCLETLFGDPYQPDNPVGHAAIMADDERRQLFAAGERLLDGWNANAEFVPRELGGRLESTDALVRRLRPVFRRDAALGVGYGVDSFMAASAVWLSDSEVARKRLAELLLAGGPGGGKVSGAHHELTIGPDLRQPALRAARHGPQIRLTGRQEVINNAGRAQAAVVVAGIGDSRSGGSHSLLLVQLAELPAGCLSRLPRWRTDGIRGCQIGGLSFDSCPVPEQAMIGMVGEGMPVARPSLPVSRCVAAGIGLGMVDGALFTVLRFAVARRLYGRCVGDFSHARAVLASAFTDLLIADCLVTAAARAVHLLPVNADVYSAATKYLVPLMLEEAVNNLAVVLGARCYLREGEHAVFGKHMRDLPALGIVLGGGLPSQLTVLRQLPGLMRALPESAEAPPELFDPSGPVPPWEPDQLGPTSPMGNPQPDPLLAALPAAVDTMRSEHGGEAGLGALAAELVVAMRELSRDAAGIPPGERGVLAGPASLALTDRYATLLAAAACIGVWTHHPGQLGPAGTAWLQAALSRLLHRIGRHPAPVPTELDDALYAELLRRAGERRGFGLSDELVSRTLPGAA